MRQAAVVFVALASLLTTALAHSQPKTRASGMREFTPAFWQTMPEVSPLCRTIMDELMYAIAGQLRTWDVGAYNNVILGVKKELISEPVSPNREVISQLNWLECRDLVLWGINNRQPTPQELPGIRAAEARRAEQQRLEAEQEAERQRNRTAFEERMRRNKAEQERFWAEREQKRIRAKEAQKALAAEREREKQERRKRWEEKERRTAEARQRLWDEAVRKKQERERAKAEKRRKLEERRRQLSGG